MTTEMQRPGGRSERTRAAVLKAAFDVIAEGGYEALTVDAVADRSRVHKTTIYRRWGSIDAVLFDAVLTRAEQAIPLERTGDPMGDLRAMAGSVSANLEDPVARAVAAAALARSDVDGFGELTERFWAMRIADAAGIVTDAQEAGDLDAALDPGLVIEKIIGPIWFRVIVVRRGVDAAFIASLVEGAVATA